MEQPMATVRTNDAGELWYDVQGQGHPLTLIGGFALLESQFEFCTPALAQRHTVINWCPRNHGKSNWTMTSTPSLEQWVEDMRSVLDAAGVQKTAIWCTSTGAPIGIRFAAKYPERTTALIAYPWFKTDDTWRGILDTAFMTAKFFGVENMSRLFAGSVFPADLLYAKEGIEYEKWAKKVYKSNVNMTTLRKVLDAYTEIDLTGDVPHIKCPTMLLMGDDSAQNLQEQMQTVGFEYLTRTFMELLPTAELGAIKGAGSTYCMVTKPDACTDTVLNYLRRVLPA
jgi:pimeloyl-ACP methyl ester carboxylesterase